MDNINIEAVAEEICNATSQDNPLMEDENKRSALKAKIRKDIAAITNGTRALTKNQYLAIVQRAQAMIANNSFEDRSIKTGEVSSKGDIVKNTIIVGTVDVRKLDEFKKKPAVAQVDKNTEKMGLEQPNLQEKMQKDLDNKMEDVNKKIDDLSEEVGKQKEQSEIPKEYVDQKLIEETKRRDAETKAKLEELNKKYEGMDPADPEKALERRRILKEGGIDEHGKHIDLNDYDADDWDNYLNFLDRDEEAMKKAIDGTEITEVDAKDPEEKEAEEKEAEEKEAEEKEEEEKKPDVIEANAATEQVEKEAAAAAAIEAAKELTEEKVEMTIDQIKDGSLNPDEEKQEDILKMEKEANDLAREAVGDEPASDELKEEFSELKDRENEIEKLNIKQQDKQIEKVEDELNHLQKIQDDIQIANANLRVGEISSVEYTKQMEYLEKEKAEQQRVVGNMNVKEVSEEMQKRTEAREEANEFLGEDKDDLKESILDEETLEKDNELAQKSIDLEKTIERETDETTKSNEAVAETTDKTLEHLEEEKHEYAEGTVGRMQAEAKIANIEVNIANDREQTKEINNAMEHGETVSTPELEKVKKYSEQNKELGGIVEELSKHDKLARVADTPEVIEEVSKAQEARKEPIEKTEKTLEM